MRIRSIRGHKIGPADGAPSRAMATRRPGCGRTLSEIEESVRRERNRAKAAAAGRRCRDRILQQMQTDPGHEKHGTPTGYTYGCRCERCREAQAERKRKYARRTSHPGTGKPKKGSPWFREFGTFEGDRRPGKLDLGSGDAEEQAGEAQA